MCSVNQSTYVPGFIAFAFIVFELQLFSFFHLLVRVEGVGYDVIRILHA